MRGLLLALTICIACISSTQADALEDLATQALINKVVNPMLEQLAGQIPGLVENAIKGITEHAPNVINSIINSISGLFGKRDLQIEELAVKLNQIKEKLVAQIKKIYADLLVKLVKSNNKRDADAAATEVSGGVGKAVKDALNEALSHLKNIFGLIVSQGISKGIDAIHPDGKRAVLDTFNDLFKQLSEALNGHVNTLTGVLNGHVQDLKEKLVPIFKTAQNDLIGHGLAAAQTILSGLAGASQSLKDGKRGLLDDLKIFEQFENVKSQLTAALTQHKDKLVAILLPQFQKLQDELIAHGFNALQSVQDALKGAVESLTGKRGLWEDLLGGISIQDELAKLQAQLADAVIQHKDNLVAVLTPQVEALKQSIANHGTNAWKAVLDALKGMVDSLGGGAVAKRGALEDFLGVNFKDTFAQVQTKVLEAILLHRDDLVAKLLPHYNELKNKLGDHAKAAAQTLLDAVKGAVESLGVVGKRGIWEDLLASMNLGGISIQQKFAEIQAKMIEALILHKDDILAKLQPQYDALLAQLGEHAKNVAQSTLEAIKNALGAFTA